jgi:hypothetical protein
MFFFSLMQDGPRGVDFISQVVNEQGEAEDVAQFGIDWPIMENHTFMSHWANHNPVEARNNNVFVDPIPNLSDIPCDPPNSPFNVEEIQLLNEHLRLQFGDTLGSHDMGIRRTQWIIALDCSVRLYQQNYQ